MRLWFSYLPTGILLTPSFLPSFLFFFQRSPGGSIWTYFTNLTADNGVLGGMFWVTVDENVMDMQIKLKLLHLGDLWANPCLLEVNGNDNSPGRYETVIQALLEVSSKNLDVWDSFKEIAIASKCIRLLRENSCSGKEPDFQTWDGVKQGGLKKETVTKNVFCRSFLFPDPTLPLSPVESEIIPSRGEVVGDSASQTTAWTGIIWDFCSNAELWLVEPEVLPGPSCAGTHLEEKGFQSIPEKRSVKVL